MLSEDNAAEKLSDKRYEQLSSDYEQEQAILETQNAELLTEIEAFDELTTPMLNEFVERILVHEADKSSGERVQEVDIVFNFIGKFDLPLEIIPPTEEELAAERKRREKLAKQREYNRRWYAKKRAEVSAMK